MVRLCLTKSEVELMHLLQKWGLVPSWTKRPPEKPLSTFNARDDSVSSGKGMWGGLRNKRCVIVAQGCVAPFPGNRGTDGGCRFYEWLVKGKEKLPHFTKPKEQPLMVMAGLWDEAKCVLPPPSLATPANPASQVRRRFRHLQVLHDHHDFVQQAALLRASLPPPQSRSR